MKNSKFSDKIITAGELKKQNNSRDFMSLYFNQRFQNFRKYWFVGVFILVLFLRLVMWNPAKFL